ncbi:hypothetical protein Hanom_Chr00s000004g01607521 [Helianthus anomalus]
MLITDDHLLVFEMVDLRRLIRVFLSVPNPVAALVFEHSVDDEVPVTLVVDNHYVSLYYLLFSYH